MYMEKHRCLIKTIDMENTNVYIKLIVRKKSEKDAYLRQYRHFVKKRF